MNRAMQTHVLARVCWWCRCSLSFTTRVAQGEVLVYAYQSGIADGEDRVRYTQELTRVFAVRPG